jgi:hypothetical protein
MWDFSAISTFRSRCADSLKCTPVVNFKRYRRIWEKLDGPSEEFFFRVVKFLGALGSHAIEALNRDAKLANCSPSCMPAVTQHPSEFTAEDVEILTRPAQFKTLREIEGYTPK